MCVDGQMLGGGVWSGGVDRGAAAAVLRQRCSSTEKPGAGGITPRGYRNQEQGGEVVAGRLWKNMTLMPTSEKDLDKCP